MAVSAKKAKKVARQQRLKQQREQQHAQIATQSNRQRKAALRQAAVAKLQLAQQPRLTAVIDGTGTTLGGPESHAMWLQ